MTGTGLATAAVAAVAVVVSAITATAVLTATTAAVMVLGLEFLGGSIAHHLDKAAVTHRLTSQLVVEVHDDLVVGHLEDSTLDAHAFLSHHGHDGIRTDVLAVKLAIDVEDFFL